MEHKTDETPGEYDINAPQNHKEIIALIKRISGQANFIGTPRIYVDIFDGDLNTAVWFNQVVYWDGKTSEPIGFYKTYAEWKKELGLSEFQIRRAANHCQVRGLVNIAFKKVYGTPKNHYLVVWPALLKLLRQYLNKPDPEETEGSETKGSEGEENEGSMEGLGTPGSLIREETPTKSQIEEVWDSITDSLKSQMHKKSYLDYVEPARAVSLKDGVLTISEPSLDACEWATERMTATIEILLVGILNIDKPRVEFVVAIQEAV